MLLFVTTRKSAFICTCRKKCFYLKSFLFMTLPEIYTVAHNIHRAFICIRKKKCFYLYPQKKVLLFVPTEKSAFICTRRKKCFYLYMQKNGALARHHTFQSYVPIQFKNVSHITLNTHAKRALVKEIKCTHATATIQLVPSYTSIISNNV